MNVIDRTNVFTLILTFVFTAGYTYLFLTRAADLIVPAPLGVLLLIFIIGFLASLIICSIIHELGHVVFGLLSGYRLEAFSVMSYTFVKLDGRCAVRQLYVPGAIGATFMAPSDSFRGKYTLYIFGGVIFTLIAAAAFTAAGFTAKTPASCMFFFTASLTSYLLTIHNAVPLKKKGVYNDCMVWKLFRKDSRAAELFFKSEIISFEALKGIPLEAMPEDLFEIPESYYDAPFANELRFNKAEYLLHTCRFEEAEKELDSLLNTVSADDVLHDAAVCLQIMISLQLNSDLERTEETYMRNRKKLAALSRYNLTAKCACIACRLKFENASALERDITDFYSMAKKQDALCCFETQYLEDLLHEYGLSGLIPNRT